MARLPGVVTVTFISIGRPALDMAPATCRPARCVICTSTDARTRMWVYVCERLRRHRARAHTDTARRQCTRDVDFGHGQGRRGRRALTRGADNSGLCAECSHCFDIGGFRSAAARLNEGGRRGC